MADSGQSTGSKTIEDQDVALAFGLVVAAGLSTAVGAASVFFVKHTNLKMLAASLGASAGVMMYVSFVEIFTTKSYNGFLDAGYADGAAKRYATLCFFGGMFIIWLLDKLVHVALHIASHGMKALDVIKFKKKERSLERQLRADEASSGGTHHAPHAAPGAGHTGPDAPSRDVSVRGPLTTTSRASSDDHGAGRADVESGVSVSATAALAPLSPTPPPPAITHPHCGCHGVAALLSGGEHQHAVSLLTPTLNTHKPLATREPASDLPRDAEGSTCARDGDCDGCGTARAGLHGDGGAPSETDGAAVPPAQRPDRASENEEAVAAALTVDHGHGGLSRMGLLAALAIGIHNLPEGLATFVGTLADPTAGIAIAVAIALHNIPEGLVVAMPIYYASGSKWKGFFWGVLSGVTEPIGALLGWAVLQGKDLDPLAYAVMFGLVGGMMVYISLSELLPTALKYDPGDSVTTWAVVGGMAVMAASLLLFAL